MSDQSESDKRGPVNSEHRPLADPPFVPPVAPPDPQPIGASPAEQLGIDAGSVERRDAQTAADREPEAEADHPWMPRRRLTDAQIRLAYDMERVSEALAGGHALPPLHTLPGKSDDERIDLFIKSQREQHDARVKDAKRVHADIEARQKEEEVGWPVSERERHEQHVKMESDARAQGKQRARIVPLTDAPNAPHVHEGDPVSPIVPNPQRVSPGDDKRWTPEHVSTNVVQPKPAVDPDRQAEMMEP